MSVTHKNVEPTYNSKITCLYCEKEFSIQKVRTSFIYVTKKDGDFCCHYKNINPYYYEIYICQHCNFAFNDKFSTIKQYKRDVIKTEYIAKINPVKLKIDRDINDAFKAYKLALFCATLAEQSNFVIAGLCLKIAWLYRYKENEIEEKRFLENALIYFTKTYDSENIEKQNINRDMLLYLIAELNARLGNYEEARKWFSTIIQDRSIKSNIMKMARERWLDYKYDESVS